MKKLLKVQILTIQNKITSKCFSYGSLNKFEGCENKQTIYSW